MICQSSSLKKTFGDVEYSQYFHSDFAGYVKLSDIVNNCIFVCRVSLHKHTIAFNSELVSFLSVLWFSSKLWFIDLVVLQMNHFENMAWLVKKYIFIVSIFTRANCYDADTSNYNAHKKQMKFKELFK